MRSAGCILLVALSGSVIGCGPRVTEEECLLLLDRYTDKVIDQARPSMSTAERREKLFEARKKAQRDPLFAECSSEVSRAQFDCAMAASNADELERCLM